MLIKEATKKGYVEANIGDCVNLEQPNSKTRRGRVGKRMVQTLTTSPQLGCVVPSKECGQQPTIRKLTPKEYLRLMGFDDSDVDLLITNGISNTQLYKMAGNSIVVNMLEYLFCQIFDDNNDIWV
ncbi:MAG: DNA cytosine methyltransferase [Lachnospiraceae bacterium]